MKLKEKNFDPDKIEFILNIPKLIFHYKGLSKLKIFELFLPINQYFIKFTIMPLLKVFKYLGRSLAGFLGLKVPKYDVLRLKEYLLTKEDGARECTDVYLPKHVFKNKSKAPTIMVRLPYGKDMLCILGYYFASLGYATVIQDIRGTTNSSEHGTFALTYYMRKDGLETLEWITKRSWYNGKLGTWGASFFGMTQLSVCWDNNDLVTCMNPSICSITSPIYTESGLKLHAKRVMGNILFRMIVQKDIKIKSLLWDEAGVGNVMKYYYNPLKALYNEPIDSSSALLSLKVMEKLKDDPEKLTKLINEKFGLNFDFSKKDKGNNIEKFLSEAIFKNNLDMSYRFLPYGFGFTGKNVNTPMLCLATWYDMFIEHFLLDMKDIKKNSPEYFKKNFKLIIGPGGHGGLDFFNIPYPNPIPKIPDIRDVISLYQHFLPFEWYEYWLKNDGKDLEKVPTFMVWILNKHIWRYFNNWPPKSQQKLLYLHSNGKANSRFGDGTLNEVKPADEPFDEFDFDPSDPVNTRGGRFLIIRSGKRNQSEIEKRDDILIYTSDKLKDGLEILGEVRLIFYASSSCIDTDFMVKLVDVFNNNKAINIIDNGIRARFREGLDNPKLLEPDKIYEYDVYIGTTGYFVRKNHRIRIEITSSNFPKFDINANLGGKKGDKKLFEVAHQKVFHNKDHSSHLILPIYREENPD